MYRTNVVNLSRVFLTIALLLSVPHFSGGLRADDQPTLQETVDWLQGKIDAESPYSYRYARSRGRMKCSVSMSTSTRMSMTANGRLCVPGQK
jgi:hypothetical protein